MTWLDWVIVVYAGLILWYGGQLLLERLADRFIPVYHICRRCERGYLAPRFGVRCCPQCSYMETYERRRWEDV